MMAGIRVYDHPADVMNAVRDEWKTWNPGKGIFLSGGSTFKELYDRPPLTEATLFLADERMVPADDPNSTQGMMHLLFGGQGAQLDFRPPVPTESSEAYERVLRDFVQKGNSFHTALLGIGSDGHTASLFPKAYADFAQDERWVREAEAELAPFVPRITVTQHFLKTLPSRIFVATGTDKRDIVRRVFLERENLPVTDLADGALVFLDAAAAADLPLELYQRL
jgi:6-phosphogluconolactonase